MSTGFFQELSQLNMELYVDLMTGEVGVLRGCYLRNIIATLTKNPVELSPANSPIFLLLVVFNDLSFAFEAHVEILRERTPEILAYWQRNGIGCYDIRRRTIR